MSLAPFARDELSLTEKLWQVNWGLVLILGLIGLVGFAMLYSAANGSADPWAWRQAVRFMVGLGVLLAAAVIDIRIWLRLAYPIYGAVLVLLIAVEIGGTIGMGARRWIDLGLIQIQPSELMKVALVLVLARYFHAANPNDRGWLGYLLPPLVLLAAPVLLVSRQPDLGTAMILLMVGVSVFFLAGVTWRFFATLFVAALAAIPLGWQFLHGYQKARILTFFDPERDPLGAGYQILQSKIAFGSGGVFGKGFLGGSQSHLNFLPEKQTDFIFTMLAEEWGLMGGLALLTLYGLVILYGIFIALSSRSHFGRLLALGVTMIFFLYVFINIAMVTGLMPVVGVPLPFVSYGGTALLSLLFAFGLVINVWIHREVRLSRFGQSGADA